MVRTQKRSILELFLKPGDFDIALDEEARRFVNLGRKCTKERATPEAIFFRHHSRSEEHLIILPFGDLYFDNFCFRHLDKDGVGVYSKIEQGQRAVRMRHSPSKRFTVRALVITTPILMRLEEFINTKSCDEVLGLNCKLRYLRQFVEDGKMKVKNLADIEIMADNKGDLYIFNSLVNNPDSNFDCKSFFDCLMDRIEQKCGKPSLLSYPSGDRDEEIEEPLLQWRETAESLLHKARLTTTRQLHSRSSQLFEGRQIISQRGRLGLCDENGDFVIPAEFDEMFYNHSLMIVGTLRRGEEWTLKDYSGRCIEADEQTKERVIAHEDNYFYM